MAKTILVVFALCLTYVSCQDPTSQACLDATTALGTSDCATQLASGSNAVCSGTCGDLYSDVFDQCGIVSCWSKFIIHQLNSYKHSSMQIKSIKQYFVSSVHKFGHSHCSYHYDL